LEGEFYTEESQEIILRMKPQSGQSISYLYEWNLDSTENREEYKKRNSIAESINPRAHKIKSDAIYETNLIDVRNLKKNLLQK
jgi:hypothetical protein